MTAQEFFNIITKFTANRQELMNVVKANEYSVGDERMSNFIDAGKIISVWLEKKVANNDPICTPAEAAWLFCVKHEVSKIKELTDQGQLVFAKLIEKYSDSSNYNDLQFAMLAEDLLCEVNGEITW